MISLNPITFRKMSLQNRFVRSATCEYMADEQGFPGNDFINLYKTLAMGKIGIIITGYAYVMPNGKSNNGQAGIYSDKLIPAWKKVTSAIQSSGSILICQIVHGGRQVRKKSNPGPIIAPSEVPCPVYKTNPRAMTKQEIDEVIQAFINAASRAEKAGFHGIQIHAAHGYLLSQFLSPYTNRREDEYGGDQIKRTLIVKEIIKGIREIVSKEFIIAAKVNGEDFIDGGLNLEQAVISAKILKNAGLDFIEISGAMVESKLSVARKVDSILDEAYFKPHARAIKKATGLITAVVGGFRTAALMDQTILMGNADLISLSRPFIREPDLLIKFKNSTLKKATCISCNKCFNPKGLSCYMLKKGNGGI